MVVNVSGELCLCFRGTDTTADVNCKTVGV